MKNNKFKLDTTHLRAEEIAIPVAGAIGAILYQRIKFYCDLNKEGNKVKYEEDGRWWTWASYGSLADEYVYWSVDQIRRSLGKLVDSGLLLVKHRARQFKNSSKYSSISLDEWLVSDLFQSLDESKRKLVLKICDKRNIVTSYGENIVTSYGENIVTSYGENHTRYGKNHTPCGKNHIANTDIVTNIRNNLSELSNFEDLSEKEFLEIEYNSLIITKDQYDAMIFHFGRLFNSTLVRQKDLDSSILILYSGNLYNTQYPYWVRLLYGVEQSILSKDTIKGIAENINEELGSNPYIVNILRKELPADFDWTSLGIDPDFYEGSWSNLYHKLFTDVKKC